MWSSIGVCALAAHAAVHGCAPRAHGGAGGCPGVPASWSLQVYFVRTASVNWAQQPDVGCTGWTQPRGTSNRPHLGSRGPLPPPRSTPRKGQGEQQQAH
jgi:hypothetical protein